MNQNNSQVSTEIWVMQTKIHSRPSARIGTARTSSLFTEFHFSIIFKTKEFLWENLSKNEVMSLLIIANHWGNNCKSLIYRYFILSQNFITFFQNNERPAAEMWMKKSLGEWLKEAKRESSFVMMIWQHTDTKIMTHITCTRECFWLGFITEGISMEFCENHIFAIGT